ncbi:MAG: alpha/beta hydrolase [Flavisolibacter sp.]|jgi:acetyl esterase/lipase|nr:alpha/beta hydrolase [Flavisolibacter sp.]
MKQLFSVFFIAFFFVACQKETTTGNEALAEQKITDVSYGSDPAQRMDVYLPANRNTTDTKVFIMVHGGAWESGDKIDFEEYIPIFKQRLPGYAIFNINYRLLVLPNTNPFPTQENDVKAAFNFISGKGDAYKFNPAKLAVLGASAGGHLALLQAYKNATPKVKAIVDMFGPTDMTALYTASNSFSQLGLTYLLSGTPTSNATLYQSSSPLNYVTAQSPPTLILHGGNDPLVPIAQSTALKTKLETMGATVQMVIYPLEGHGWTGASLNDTYDKITAFLTTYNQ